MPKYNINKEFLPFSLFAPPIQNAKMAGWMGSKMQPPRWVKKSLDREVSITKETVKSYDGANISVFVIDPYGLEERSPCLVYYDIAFVSASSENKKAVYLNYSCSLGKQTRAWNITSSQ